MISEEEKENRIFKFIEINKKFIVKHNLGECLADNHFEILRNTSEIERFYHEIVWDVLRKYPIHYKYCVTVDNKSLQKPVFIGKIDY